MNYRYDIFNRHPFHTHTLAYDLIDNGSKVLDIGCATGYFAKELSKKKCEVWGVDHDEEAIKKAAKYVKKVVSADFDSIKSLPFPKKYFDYVLILDVIEHLRFPEKLLEVAKQHTKNDGKLIISVPNIAHASMRWSLFKGEFEYTTTGLMDSTHYHFYTKKTFEETLLNNGFKIIKLLPTNGMTKVPLLRKFTDRLPAVWQYKIACALPTLFSYQFVALLEISKVKR